MVAEPALAKVNKLAESGHEGQKNSRLTGLVKAWD